MAARSPGAWKQFTTWVDRERLRAFRHRWQRTLVLTGVTGALTGLAIAAFAWVTDRVLFEHVVELPVAFQALLPGVGLVGAWLALRTFGRRTTPATADEYIANFHDRDRPLDATPAPGKVTAAVATLGAGGALGFEGPSLYIGSSIGTAVQRRFHRFFGREDAKVLMVAGAAAGVAAIFKTPATGAVFAVEVPYQSDVAARSVLPALVASVTSYLTYVAFWGTAPLLSATGTPDFDAPDLLGAVAIGVLAGVGARLLAWMFSRAKQVPTRLPAPMRLLGAAAAMAALVAIGAVVFDESLVIGPGYAAIEWAADTRHGLVLVAALFVVRALASSTTLAGGGVGGVFIPLVVQGALLGRIVGDVVGADARTLFPLVGAAAFLGAGYRTPIAAIVFVAESTGRPGFVVPGVIATVLAQLVMGRSSVSPYQIPRRSGYLEDRLELPVRAALVAETVACPADASITSVLEEHFRSASGRSMPVVEDGRVLGTIRFDDAVAIPPADRPHITASDVARRDVPLADPQWTLLQAIHAMEAAGVDQLPVVEGATFLGVITTEAIVRLDALLDDSG